MIKTSMTLIFFFGLYGLSTTLAYAHYPWINMSNYNPDAGDSLQFTIGWGHRYPLGGFLQQDELENIIIVGPKGNKLVPQAATTLEFKLKKTISEPGTYTIAAQRKTGFYTKTAEGGKRQSKKGLENVKLCTSSHMSMKAIVNIGVGGGELEFPLNHPLEIVPLANPADLTTGDYFPIRLLLHGQPHQGMVFATYMGFSTDKETFAYTSKTDRQGKTRIRILQPGIWLIKAEFRKTYPDRDVCDVEAFVSTLTLEIK